MSIANDDILLVGQPEESSTRTPKQSKISYAREFLLSLSDLEVCKKLPSGFDESILSEFEGSTPSFGNQDRPRVPCTSSLQGFRRSDYGSSPPTKGDVGNYSRATHRWDSRSNGQSETDSQSDKDSDSGKRYGNQSRRPWQNPEHDGLLGSGSFPRPSGYGAGPSVARLRAGDNNQLNKSNEPYQPPRPYKAAPHSKRETNDFHNDETFGSTESTSQDRVEEERKRRAEFELMRKEQQKVLQETLKLSSRKHKEDPFTQLLDDPRDDKMSKEVTDPLIKPSSQHDSSKLSVSSQAPPIRPLVPPGFPSSVAERNSGAKPLDPSNPAEAGEFEPEDGHQYEKESAWGMGFIKQQSETARHSPYNGGKDANLPPLIGESLEISNSSAASKVIGNGEMMQLERTSVKQIVDESSQATSILEKLFGSVLSGDGVGGAKLVEDEDTKTRDTLSPHGFQSSKFAHWFLEKGNQPVENVSHENSIGLLSLISGEKGAHAKATPEPTSELYLGIAASDMSSTSLEPTGVSEHLNKNKIKVMPAVLTCEDLEQSILSGINESNLDSQPLGEGYYASVVEAEQPKTTIDNSASQHLLSLLQKGMGSKILASSSILDQRSLDHQHENEPRSNDVIHRNVKDGMADKSNSSGNTLTLETLFGTAFMQELQSVGAPVSSQRSSVGSTRADASSDFAISDDGLYPSGIERIGAKSCDSSIFRLNDRQQKINPGVEGPYSGFDYPRSDSERSWMGSKLVAYDVPPETRLPEEDSLIVVSSAANVLGSMFTLDLDATNFKLLSSSPGQPVNIAEKLASLGAPLEDEHSVVGGQEHPLFLHAKTQSSPFHFHPQQMNHRRPLFHPLDPHPSHIDPQLNYLAPEPVIRHDGRTHHQFPPNMVHPPYHNPGPVLQEFDHSIHHPLLQQMHMPTNLPHAPHAPRGFPGGAPIPLHPSNIPTSYPQEHNPMQGFPFRQQHPNFSGAGLPPSGLESAGGINNSPEAFQRLLEMEFRSNQKQMHPFPPSSHTQPMHGDELETGFWYR
ncbi:hypothetical protein Dimus_025294 [Dionaea muscipula]